MPSSPSFAEQIERDHERRKETRRPHPGGDQVAREHRCSPSQGVRRASRRLEKSPASTQEISFFHNDEDMKLPMKRLPMKDQRALLLAVGGLITNSEHPKDVSTLTLMCGRKDMENVMRVWRRCWKLSIEARDK